jgi:hypothetical protein
MPQSDTSTAPLLHIGSAVAACPGVGRHCSNWLFEAVASSIASTRGSSGAVGSAKSNRMRRLPLYIAGSRRSSSGRYVCQTAPLWHAWSRSSAVFCRSRSRAGRPNDTPSGDGRQIVPRACPWKPLPDGTALCRNGSSATPASESLPAPDLVNLDCSLSKDVRITERASAQFRGEFFNALTAPTSARPE